MDFNNNNNDNNNYNSSNTTTSLSDNVNVGLPIMSDDESHHININNNNNNMSDNNINHNNNNNNNQNGIIREGYDVDDMISDEDGEEQQQEEDDKEEDGEGEVEENSPVVNKTRKKKESDDDYIPSEEEEEEESESDKDNDQSYQEEEEDEEEEEEEPISSRSRRTTNNFKLSDYLLDDEEDDEDEEDEYEAEDDESDSDYSPTRKKSKKLKKPAKKKSGQLTRSQRRKRDEELASLRAQARPTRERRQTVRLYDELKTDDNGTNENDDGGDGGYQSSEEEEEGNSDHSYSQEEDEDSEYNDSDEGYDSDEYSPPSRRKKRPQKPAFETITLSNLRDRRNLKTYKIQDTDSDDQDYDEEMQDGDEDDYSDEDGGRKKQKQQQVKQIGPFETVEDIIEQIMDHRLKSSVTTTNADGSLTSPPIKKEEDDEEETTFNVEKYQFLVKWKGWAHIHDTWDSYDQLIPFKGNKKLINYVKALLEQKQWRKEASREDIEQADIVREMDRQEYQEKLQVERIISKREIDAPAGEEYKSGVQYLVKWYKSAYSEVTWEHPEDIKQYQNEIDNYLERCQTPRHNPGGVSAKRRLDQGFEKYETQPDWITAGKLRDYQMDGLNWLICSWINNTNVILADEMGLGKTIQTISFLSYLFNVQQMSGPYLVVVPLSTIENWQREFAKWAPKMNLIVYTGSASSRDIIREYEFYQYQYGKKKLNFNVLLTTYDFILKDKQFLGSIKWDYLAVDEAHRLKNNESMLHEVLKFFKTGNRLLVTGTPLQNSMKELWNLLNFLMPNKFHSLKDFQDQWSDLKEKDQIAELHNVLKPHLLRRIKKEVEKSLPAKTERILRVDLSPLQKKYYKLILTKNFQELNKGVKGEKTNLLNIVVELKKTCNHPYLFESAENENVNDSLDALIKGSGKLILLDKLLIRLKETGHRVLIFSQMVRMLDLLAHYLKLRGFLFQRLDGSMSREKRNQAMDRFNAPGSPDFCFLLSTRAGGLGINLSTADTVVIFDSDYNPQNDLQAEARAHRIGQKNAVNIYRLVCKKTVEEDILERAKQKMVLDHLVIQSMDTKSNTAKSSAPSQVFNKEELDAILKFGAEDLFKESDDAAQQQQPEMDIDEILSRAEQRSESNDLTAGEELLNSFRVANFTTSKEKEDINWESIIPDKDRQQPEQENLYLPPRRARTETSKSAAAKKAATDSITLTIDPKKEITAINKKDLKTLIKSLRKFGDYHRSKEILADSNIKQVNLKIIEDICREVIEICKKSKRDHPECDKITIMYSGVDINASEFVQKIEEMETLADLVKPHLHNYEQFRVTFPVRPVAWAIKWGAKEDAMLLMGIHKHGNGNWESIQKDTSLGLENIISVGGPTGEEDPSQAAASTTKIKGPSLQRRVDSLLKSAKESIISKKKPISTITIPKLANKKRLSATNKSGSKNNSEENNEQDDEAPKKRGRAAKTSTTSTATTKKSAATPTRRGRAKSETSEDDKHSPPPVPKRTSSGRVSLPPTKLGSENGRSSSSSSGKRNSSSSAPTSSSSRRKLMSDEEMEESPKRGRKRKDHSDDEKSTTKSTSSSSSSSSSSTTTTTTPTKRRITTNHDDLDPKLLSKCEGYLQPVQKHLDKFRNLTDNISREDKVRKTKKYMLSLGNEISKILGQQYKSVDKVKLEKHLWLYASGFTALGGDDLKKLFDKMKKGNNNSSPSDKPAMKLVINKTQ